jgi:hypothetical protein
MQRLIAEVNAVQLWRVASTIKVSAVTLKISFKAQPMELASSRHEINDKTTGRYWCRYQVDAFDTYVCWQ